MPWMKTDKELKPRPANDHYRTDPVLCRNAIIYFVEETPERVLDPGAGTGSWGTAVKTFYPQAQLTGVENDEQFGQAEGYDSWVQQDFLLWTPPKPDYDLVIGNPPYKYAEGFITQSLSCLKAGGMMLFLLRLEFLGAIRRKKGLFTHDPPMDVIVLSRRPQFYETSGTDALEYALFRWRKGWRGRTETYWWDWKDNTLV